MSIDLTRLAEAVKQVWEPFIQDGANGIPEPHAQIITNAAGAILNADQTYRCSQHGYRATPRCNDNPACSLQLGVWVGITEATNGY